MEIIVNGLPAAIKKGSSFDYILENRYFSGVDDYTLSIEFPLKDCPVNRRIFGRLNSHEVAVPNTLYECLINNGALSLKGVLKIVETSHVSVKCQFLSGRTAENYASSFDDIMINTLQIPWPTFDILHDSDFDNPDPEEIMRKYGYGKSADSSVIARGYVTLPWFNNSTGVFQNKPGASTHIPRGFDNSVEGLSVQPYLWYLLEKILDAVGYTADLSIIKSHPKWKYLLVCNSLPYVWDIHDFSRALPAWSLSKLLEQVEYLLNGEFTIDHLKQTVRFDFCADKVEDAGTVVLNNVINDFDTEEQDTEDSEYRESIHLKYAECDHEMQKYYSCQWLIDHYIKIGMIHVFNSYNEMKTLLGSEMKTTPSTSPSHSLAMFKSMYGDYMGEKIFYVKDIDKYYIVTKADVLMQTYDDPYGGEHKCYHQMYFLSVAEINEFCPDGDGKEIELDIVPAWIDKYYNSGNEYIGNCIFLDTGDYDEKGSEEDLDGVLTPVKMLENGEVSNAPEYLDKIYVGFFNGVNPTSNLLCPHTTRYPMFLMQNIPSSLIDNDSGFTLALRDKTIGTYGGSYMIDSSHKYKFQWLSNRIPKVESVFVVNGVKFMCAKITATFTEDGMSEKLKGEFYRVIEQ